MAHEIFLYYASILYSVDMTGLMLILALFTNKIVKEEKGLVAKDSLNDVRQARNRLYLSAALFAISAFRLFWMVKFLEQPMRYYLWFVRLIVSMAGRVTKR